MTAFPNMNKDIHPDVTKERGLNGMDLRDYFAAKTITAMAIEFWNLKRSDEQLQDVAKMAYRIADAMMEARNDSK